MRAVLVGLGAVGSRCARQLLSSRFITELVVLSRRPSAVEAQVAALGGDGAVHLDVLREGTLAQAAQGAAVVLLAVPRPGGWAEVSVDRGTSVVSVCEDPTDVKVLLGLDEAAQAAQVSVVAGAAMAPGLSCLLAWWAAGRMDEVTELHVATLGTGGPSCARRRHAALREPLEEWRDGRWARKMGGSGRDLVWFPGSAGADCYRTNRADPLLLTRAFPHLRVATTRAAASRRDRFTSWLPMLRPPHPEGTVGAVRVEARGRRDGAAESVIVGVSGRPALLAATVAAAAAACAAAGELRPGAGGLATLARDPAAVLVELTERGVRLMTFEGYPVRPALAHS